MDKQIGGRGKKAPYESTHVRVPLPIKDRVEKIKLLFLNDELENYDQEVLENYRLADEYRNLLTGNEKDCELGKTLQISLESALQISKKIVSQKKSARISIANLLTALYGTEVDPKDL